MNSETVVQPRSNGSKPIRVLMADPDESLQPLYREPLLQEGFELVTAVSGLGVRCSAARARTGRARARAAVAVGRRRGGSRDHGRGSSSLRPFP